MSRERRLNDDERRQWILNDEGLYLWQRQNDKNMMRFIRNHRQEIDRIILGTLNNQRQTHRSIL